MEILIGIGSLGILCLVLEIFNLRKLMAPVVIAGLLGLLVWNFMLWDLNTSWYNDMFRFDNFAVAFTGLLLLLSIFIALMGGDFYKSEPQHWSDYLSIFLFTLCGAVIMVGYSNLTMLFLGIEILSISLYIMAGSNKWSLESNEAGMKYFLMGSFASGFLLFGIALVYGATGTFNLAAISTMIPLLEGSASTLLYSGFLMILVGMFFKMSAAPFHFWAPDVYQGSPSLVTAFMATIAKIAAVAAFYRLIYMGFAMAMPAMETVFMLVTVATISVGNIIAVVQTNFKRVLAFSGISHAGFMLLAIMSVSPENAGDLLYYALAYGIANITAFAVSIVVFNAMQDESFEAFNGLGKKKPLLAVALIISMLSMASIPPLSGFWAKYFIFSDAIQKGLLPVTIVGVVNTLIAVVYYFRVIAAMLLKPADDVAVKPNIWYVIVILATTAATIALGIIPGCITGLLG